MDHCCCSDKKVCRCRSSQKERGLLGKIAITGGVYLFIYFLYNLHKRQQASGRTESGLAKFFLFLIIWGLLIFAYTVDSNPDRHLIEVYIVPAIISLVFLIAA